jgi:hypothetical protein
MTDDSQANATSPYSPLWCIILLLLTGFGVKLGALCHAAGGACRLAGW